MGKKYRIGLIIVLVFVVIAVGALYLIKKHKNQPNSSNSTDCTDQNASVCKVDLASITTASATQTQVGSFGTPQTVSQNIYKNDALKFELTLSSVWLGAKITETVPAAPAEGKVEFQLSTTDKTFKNGLTTPLTIYVYKNENLPSAQDNPLLTKITSSGDLVYEYIPWTVVPSDLGQFTEKEIGQVASTLKVIN